MSRDLGAWRARLNRPPNTETLRDDGGVNYARSERPRRRVPATPWALAALVLAFAASMILLIVPSYGTECLGAADYGPAGTRCLGGTAGVTLLDANGPHVLWLLAAPPAIALVALVTRRRIARTLAAVVLVLFVVITGFSIGYAYLPSAIVMVIAALRPPP